MHVWLCRYVVCLSCEAQPRLLFFGRRGFWRGGQGLWVWNAVGAVWKL
jgi:hypothetical protein